jgi:hypothetical protein
MQLPAVGKLTDIRLSLILLHHIKVMNDYTDLQKPDREPITPVDDRIAIYQLFLELKRGFIENEHFYNQLVLWARFGFSFGRDNRGSIVLIEPQFTPTN